jgi:hypothetical protein
MTHTQITTSQRYVNWARGQDVTTDRASKKTAPSFVTRLKWEILARDRFPDAVVLCFHHGPLGKARRVVMRIRLFVPLSIAALVLALGTMAVGCGDDEELSLEEYFQQGELIGDNATARIEALDVDAFEGEFASEEDQVTAMRGSFDSMAAIIRETVDEFKDLDPPPEAEDAHGDFVGAVGAQEELFDNLVDSLAEAQSVSEVTELLGEFGVELEPVLADIEEACSTLQGIADANGIDADMKCEEE